MATYTTRSGLTFDDRKGGANLWGQRDPTQRLSYQGIDITLPKHDMASLTESEINKLITKTMREGRPLTNSEILDAAGSGARSENKIAYYHYLLDQNEQVFGFSSQVYKDYKAGPNGEIDKAALDKGTPTNPNALGATDDYYAALQNYGNRIDENIMTRPDSQLAQMYRQDLYGAIDQYEQSTNATLASAELDAYKMIGQQQLELENLIADQRMKALRSGTTSAQLASQQIASMFAAQAGAAQVSQNVMQQRAQSQSMFGQARMGVESDLYNMINTNQGIYASAQAQLAAAQGGYASYVNQPYAQVQANMNAYNLLGENDWNRLMLNNTNK